MFIKLECAMYLFKIFDIHYEEMLNFVCLLYIEMQTIQK